MTDLRKVAVDLRNLAPHYASMEDLYHTYDERGIDALISRHAGEDIPDAPDPSLASNLTEASRLVDEIEAGIGDLTEEESDFMYSVGEKGVATTAYEEGPRDLKDSTLINKVNELSGLVESILSAIHGTDVSEEGEDVLQRGRVWEKTLRPGSEGKISEFLKRVNQLHPALEVVPSRPEDPLHRWFSYRSTDPLVSIRDEPFREAVNEIVKGIFSEDEDVIVHVARGDMSVTFHHYE